MTHIYALKDDLGIVRYVGKTCRSLTSRLSAHLCLAKKGESKSHCQNWIRSMIRRGLLPSISLIETVTGDGNKSEIQWIAYFRKSGVDLTNATDGGEGTTGAVVVISPEHRLKISAALKGIKRSEETKRLIRIARAKQPPAHTSPHTKETKEKIKKALSSKKVRKKIGDANRGRVKSKQELEKARKSILKFWSNTENRKK